MQSTDGSFFRIVKLRICVTRLSAIVRTRSLRARAKIIKPSEDDRFGWANLRASRNESALLAVVTKRAFEGSAGIGQRLRPAIDHAEWTGDDAIAAAVTDIVLHENGADFGAHDRTGRARFETTGLFAMLADVGQKNPAERILAVVA